MYSNHINSYKNYFLKIKDVYYSTDFDKGSADICYIFSIEKPIEGLFYERPTIIIDLRKEAEVLFSEFSETTRRKIRKGLSDADFEYTFYELADQLLLQDNLQFYADFIQRKGMQKFERKRLQTLQKNKMLAISVIRDKSSSLVIHHLYLVTPMRVELIYSINNFEGHDGEMFKRMSIMNTLAHRNDLFEFKKRNVPNFDFGGWYPGSDDPKQLNINYFKESFGGQVVHYYNKIEYVSPVGKLIYLLKKILTIK